MNNINYIYLFLILVDRINTIPYVVFLENVSNWIEMRLKQNFYTNELPEINRSRYLLKLNRKILFKLMKRYLYRRP